MGQRRSAECSTAAWPWARRPKGSGRRDADCSWVWSLWLWGPGSADLGKEGGPPSVPMLLSLWSFLSRKAHNRFDEEDLHPSVGIGERLAEKGERGEIN